MKPMQKQFYVYGILIGLFLAMLMPPGRVLAFEFPPSIRDEQGLLAKLEAAYFSKGADYEPRTHLKEHGKPKYINRLMKAASPYLLQHAHNPVDWHLWSTEILERAKSEGKPIFLSIGYATCHWCHVMERESFDQEDVAQVLNERFIPVKIDREENPDIDQLYLTATQLQQGQAGWPNTLWLTPEGKPFHTATYLTKDELIKTSLLLSEGWRSPSARQEILAVANGLSAQVMQLVGNIRGNNVPLNDVVYSRAEAGLLKLHNELEGGFSEANQFPQEVYLLFLLEQWRRGGTDELLDVVTSTLDAIAAGGIHDQVGGGFHRYTIDPAWRTPHFEKMLYNQALLSRLFMEAWEATGKTSYRRAAERTLHYVMRDMTTKVGAFFAAEDADSINKQGHVEEGAFYTWQREEVFSLFDKNSAAISDLFGGLDALGNEGHVIHLDPLTDHDFGQLDQKLERLFEFREERTRPLKDRKVIAGWNGLMIRSLALAGSVYENEKYSGAAERAAEAIWTRLWSDGELFRYIAGGVSNGKGLLEDYAWLGLGLVSLYDATGNKEWLERAELLTNSALEKFLSNGGSLKQASLDSPLGPIVGASDDALPSAQSSMLELLGKLAHRSGDIKYFALAERIASRLSILIARKPENLPYALMANRLLLGGESTRQQFRGNGKVELRLKDDRLILKIAEGWHLAANAPGYDYLIGTKIEGAKADWPTGTKTKLGFASQAAYVYEGTLEIPLEVTDESLRVTVQACSDQICLAPEEAIFRITQR